MRWKDVEAFIGLVFAVIPFVLFVALAIWGLNFDLTRAISELCLAMLGFTAIGVFCFVLSTNKKNSSQVADLKSSLEAACGLS